MSLEIIDNGEKDESRKKSKSNERGIGTTS